MARQASVLSLVRLPCNPGQKIKIQGGVDSLNHTVGYWRGGRQAQGWPMPGGVLVLRHYFPHFHVSLGKRGDFWQAAGLHTNLPTSPGTLSRKRKRHLINIGTTPLQVAAAKLEASYSSELWQVCLWWVWQCLACSSFCRVRFSCYNKPGEEDSG